MTLFNDIIPYFDEFIHVYGWNVSILWSLLKIWTPKNFTTANFRHPVSKSWLWHWWWLLSDYIVVTFEKYDAKTIVNCQFWAPSFNILAKTLVGGFTTLEHHLHIESMQLSHRSLEPLSNIHVLRAEKVHWVSCFLKPAWSSKDLYWSARYVW